MERRVEPERHTGSYKEVEATEVIVNLSRTAGEFGFDAMTPYNAKVVNTCQRQGR